MEIYKRMISILKDVEYIKKDKVNTGQNYKFRGIDDMYNALHELFAKHEVFICSDVLELTREERQTQKGGNLIYTLLKIKFTFQTMDGSSVESIMIGEAMDSGDKSANKAMSTALKYALMQAFLIPTEELKDSDNNTYEVKKKEPELKLPEINDNFWKVWNKEILDGNFIEIKGKKYKANDKQIAQMNTYLQKIEELWQEEQLKEKMSYGLENEYSK